MNNRDDYRDRSPRRSLENAVITVSLKEVTTPIIKERGKQAWAVNVRASAAGYLPTAEQYGVVLEGGDILDATN